MNETDNTAPAFREVQRFSRGWTWGFIFPVALFLVIFFGYGVLKQLIFVQPWGNMFLPDIAMLIFGPLAVFFGGAILYIFSRLKLITEVRDSGLYVNFCPLAKWKIRLTDIRRWGVRRYNPFMEYGGWGVRYGISGKAYTVNGNMGVQLELADGKRVLIGSQRSRELARAIKEQMPQ
ncbi:MAG: hypothetical protein DRP85_06865 [Candidatus Makaraimicrobium thalassicum]|nr:MAG: hypothetical protein DRP85_06865 [Candidatus Omnitrophota bacterium]